MIKDLFNNPGFIALVGTLFGGAGLEIIRRLMDSKQRKNDDAARIREEQRKEIESLRAQLNHNAEEEQRLEAEIERWKGLYYEEKEEYLKSMTALQIITERLNNAHLRMDVDIPASE